MLEFSKKTNLLEQSIYRYTLQDVEEPNLFRDIFNYEEVPKIAFNHRRVPINMPEDIWITDTSFRDGQQSMAPYTVKQIVDLYSSVQAQRPLRHNPPVGVLHIYEKRQRGHLKMYGAGAEISTDNHVDKGEKRGFSAC